MSNAIAYPHSDPYRLPAGVLTLITHLLFFTLLYLGVSWQSQEPQGMVVDLWDSLPDVNDAPAKSMQPQQEVNAVQKAEPVKPSQAEQAVTHKADIDLGKSRKKPSHDDGVRHKRKMSKTEQKQAQAEMAAAIKQQELVEQQAMDARAKQAAAIGRMLDEYKTKISIKIRRNIVPPPDVDDAAVAEFDVTLLPGGDVLEVKLTKKSGNAAYDSAVERAIWKAAPLPVPEDPDLFNSRFRNLHLKFRPKDGK